MNQSTFYLCQNNKGKIWNSLRTPEIESKKGIDIFNALDDVVWKYGTFVKCSAIVTDADKAMVFH